MVHIPYLFPQEVASGQILLPQFAPMLYGLFAVKTLLLLGEGVV